MSADELIEGKLTESVIGAFYEVYNFLGFRFLEPVYLAALERELRARGHAVGREMWVPVFYKGEEISRQRLDMIVDERLVVEAKSTQELHKPAPRQLHNYMRATGLQVGLLLHFGPIPLSIGSCTPDQPEAARARNNKRERAAVSVAPASAPSAPSAPSAASASDLPF